MRYPLSLTLALPVLFIISSIVRDDGKGVLVFLLVFTAMLMLEIRVKHGNISMTTLKQFFNTPIILRGMIGEAPVDNSPKVSLLSGILIILFGTVLVTIALVIYFSFI